MKQTVVGAGQTVAEDRPTVVSTDQTVVDTGVGVGLRGADESGDGTVPVASVGRDCSAEDISFDKLSASSLQVNRWPLEDH